MLCVVEAAPEPCLHLLQLLHPALQEPCRLEQLLLLELKLLVKKSIQCQVYLTSQTGVLVSGQSTEEDKIDFDLVWKITPIKIRTIDALIGIIVSRCSKL